MTISIKCSCGKTLKVDEKYRGKKAKCPECGNVVLVKDPEPETAMQAEKPKKRPVADDDDDEQEVRKPIKRQAAKRNMMPWIAGGGCGLLAVFACCLGIGGGAWYYFFSGPDQDLTYVHEGVVGFVSIRYGEIWKSPVVKDQLNTLPAEVKKEMDAKLSEMETKAGMKIEDIERMTFIIRSADIFKLDFGVVVRTGKAMDRKKIVAALAKEKNEKEKEVKHEGETIYVFGGGADAGALYFATDRIVLISDKEATVKDILKQAKKNPAKNATLVRGIQMASAGKHQLVAAFELKKDLMNKMPDDVVRQVPNLRETNGVIFAGTLAKDLSMEAVLTFASKDIAAKGKVDVDTGITLMKVGAKAEPKFGPKPGPALIKFVESITVEQRGAEVVIKGKMDLDLKGFGEMPGLNFGQGPGPGPVGPGRLQSVNNLKQIGLAMHMFNDAYKALPNHAIRDPKTGQPLLSWRVALLPYLEQQALFNQIRQNERWDSPHNRQFWNQMPDVYHLPGKPKDDKTYYQVFHGDRSAFPKATRPAQQGQPAGDVRLGTIPDGSSNTIFVVEAATPVNWMQPDDIPFQMGQQGLINSIGNHWGNNTFHALFGDAAVRTMRRNMPSDTLQALITRDGGEAVFPDDWDANAPPKNFKK